MNHKGQRKTYDEDFQGIKSTIKRIPAKNAPQTNVPKDRTGGNNKPSSRRFSQTHVIMICLAVLLVVSIAIAIILIQKPKSNGLTGRWSLDDVTIYSFDGNGHGEMVLPLNTYEFSYVVEGNKIMIDFINENAEDKEYSYTISADTLILTDAAGMEFRFVKSSKGAATGTGQ